jgi:hypothetical protein
VTCKVLAYLFWWLKRDEKSEVANFAKLKVKRGSASLLSRPWPEANRARTALHALLGAPERGSSAGRITVVVVAVVEAARVVAVVVVDTEVVVAVEEVLAWLGLLLRCLVPPR